MNFLLSLFRCPHKRLTWPQGKGAAVTVVCLSCGRRLRYSWKSMAIVGEVEQPAGQRWDQKARVRA